MHAEDRHDMTKADDFYDTGDMTRSMEKMLHDDLQPGQKQRPLLHVPIGQTMVDELHLLLRITDVLERNVVLEMVEWDKLEGTTSLSKGKHLQAFLDIVKELGVSFAVWESRKTGKEVEFTSLMGPDKITLLQKLPEHFPQLLKAETCAEITWLWKEFSALYEFLSAWEPNPEHMNNFSRRAKQWINRFCLVGDRRIGYQKERVTLYMHAMAYRVPFQIKKFKSLKVFTCSSIEKRNDFGRRTFQLKSNRKDAARDVLHAQERQVLLSGFDRERRT